MATSTSLVAFDPTGVLNDLMTVRDETRCACCDATLDDESYVICRFPEPPAGTSRHLLPKQHDGHTACKACVESLAYIGEAAACKACLKALGSRRSAVHYAGVALRPAVRNAAANLMLRKFMDAEATIAEARDAEDDARRQEGVARRAAAVEDVRRRRAEAEADAERVREAALIEAARVKAEAAARAEAARAEAARVEAEAAARAEAAAAEAARVETEASARAEATAAAAEAAAAATTERAEAAAAATVAAAEATAAAAATASPPRPRKRARRETEEQRRARVERAAASRRERTAKVEGYERAVMEVDAVRRALHQVIGLVRATADEALHRGADAALKEMHVALSGVEEVDGELVDDDEEGEEDVLVCPATAAS